MLLISGLSGAGKSTVLHSLEDAGFFCTDNLPLEMLKDWAVSMQGRKQPAAVCVDARSGFTAHAIKAVIEDMRATDDWPLLFVEAEDAVLQRRFSTVRRRHPFHGSDDLMDSIRQEREALMPIRVMADLILDSSHLTPYELAEKAEQFWRKPGQSHFKTACTIMSFSYKYGLPDNADIVFDMRFLPNPHYQAGLAEQTGRDENVISFLQSYPEVDQAMTHIQQWLAFIWPYLHKERKQYFTLAFGCSGGRHRSVYMAESVATWLQRQGLAEPTIQHRELGIVQQGGRVKKAGQQSEILQTDGAS
ncbi:MAG: RNase adapter RapZ [Mariprofundus sp.]|nr:RNase adapter RapZ [Mariprofundus sp.]